MQKSELIRVASGQKPAELVLKNAKIINVFSATLEQGDIAIYNGYIAGIGNYHGVSEVDLKGAYVAPGFIDGHVHIESSMLVPHQFARLVIPFGTTSVIADPHEIANVAGIEGIRFMLESAKKTPLDVYIMIPSCVPATVFETSGATIGLEDVLKIKKMDHILGLGEVMNYPSVIGCDSEMLGKIESMSPLTIDGHSPSVQGLDLNAYIAAGISTDHEASTLSELEERVNKGVYVHLREGSQTKNELTLLKGVTVENKHRLLFCTDDKHPEDIASEGHINFNVNLAIQNGISPFWAIQMATINVATCYQIPHLGAIAPGYLADLIVFDSLTQITPKQVYKKGQKVSENGKPLFQTSPIEGVSVENSVKLNLHNIDFTLKLKSNRVHVIGLIDNNVTTKDLITEVLTHNHVYVPDPNRDILKLGVIERHHLTGNIGLGLVSGYGLKNGAVAMTIAHDSHNLLVIGDNDSDMLLAVQEVYRMQGGIALVNRGIVMDSLCLEVGGLMTQKDCKLVRDKLHNMELIARSMGVKDEIVDPFLALAFLSLPVIPDIKLTDKGLFDLNQFKLITIEAGE